MQENFEEVHILVEKVLESLDVLLHMCLALNCAMLSKWMFAWNLPIDILYQIPKSSPVVFCKELKDLQSLNFTVSNSRPW